MTEPPSITCPVCQWTSHHPKDVENGYCGNCNKFTSEPAAGELVLGPTQQTAQLLRDVLRGLDLPTILPDDPPPVGAREMPLRGGSVSLRLGDAVIFYGENGEPIDLEPAAAMAQINARRAEPGGELLADVVSRGVRVAVSTAYLGIDLSILGPLPLVWETMAFVWSSPWTVLDPIRYATRAAAHSGHEKVVAAVRQALAEEGETGVG